MSDQQESYSGAEPRYAVIERRREVNTYAELWHASHCVLEKGLAEETGSVWQFLSSVLLSACAFEAYMNHVGDAHVANWTDLERALSPIAKLTHLSLAFGADLGGKGERPLQTLHQLVRIRNLLAHGRSEVIQPKPEVKQIDADFEKYLRQRPLTAWEECVTGPEFAQRVHEDLEKILEIIHAARPEPKDPLFNMGFHVSGSSVTS